MVVRRAAQPQACVLLPGFDRKKLEDQARALESAASAAHLAAQQLNKEGRYEVSCAASLGLHVPCTSPHLPFISSNPRGALQTD